MLTHLEVKGRKYFKLENMQDGLLTYSLILKNQRFELNVFLSKNKSKYYTLDKYEINNYIIDENGIKIRGDYVTGDVICSFEELTDYLINTDIVAGE